MPSSTPLSESMSASSAPARRITSAATGVSSANMSTGAVVSSPAVAEPMPKSSSMSRSTGVGATIGPRMLSAATSTPAMTNHGMPRRARSGRLTVDRRGPLPKLSRAASVVTHALGAGTSALAPPARAP